MIDFVYEQPETRVVAGEDLVATLADEVRRLGSERAIVIATPSQWEEAGHAAEALGALGVAVFVENAPHVPIEVARRAREKAHDTRANAIVTIGGGNAIGVGKVVALELGIPIIAIPTTYSGSEATPSYGWTEAGVKKISRDDRTLPRTVLYDPALAVSLPPGVSATSGMNALAHLVMALYATDSNPIGDLLGAEGIRVLSRALPAVVAEPKSLNARADAFYGSWLAGSLAGSMLRIGAGGGFHYALCHILGGSFGLGHAEVHSVLLPHSVALVRDADPDATRKIADAMEVADPAHAVYDLAADLGCPQSLGEIGMPEDGLDRVVGMALDAVSSGPRTPTRESVGKLLDAAFRGTRPD
jgi:alcohol dehydrogenase class IV